MKQILIALLILATPMAALQIHTESEFKVGKMENGNFFVGLTPFNQTYMFNKIFSTQVKLGVGFTAPRANKAAMNHYMNSILVRNELKFGNIILGMEFNWGNIISGAANPVSVFDQTYQAIYTKVVIN